MNRTPAVMELTLRSILVVAVFCVVSGQQTVPLRRRQIVSEYINTEYVGDLTIGGQLFEVVFDTSSYNLVLPRESCISRGCDCAHMVKYRISSSTRLGPSNRETTVTMLDTANATGNEAHDSVMIRTLTAPDQGFVLATDVPDELCKMEADGVVGMGRPNSRKAAYNMPTLVETFVNLGQIEGVFSFHHARLPDGEHYGEITFGGVKTNYYTGPITYVPLVDSVTWNFRLDAVIVGNQKVISNVNGSIDTSKQIIVGPAEIVNEINGLLGCTDKRQGSTEICVFNCDEIDDLPDVTFIIGGRRFNISEEYYVQRNGELCYSGFSPCPHTKVFEIGDFFIDHYVPIFNSTNKSMGFAKSTGSL